MMLNRRLEDCVQLLRLWCHTYYYSSSKSYQPVIVSQEVSLVSVGQSDARSWEVVFVRVHSHQTRSLQTKDDNSGLGLSRVSVYV
jgi:hypothetical protein